MYHSRVIQEEWEEDHLPPFDELIFSWNASRPEQGNYLFYVSVKIGVWSPYLLYASWGNQNQSSFLSSLEGVPVRSFQDTIEVMKGQKAVGFRIKIIAEQGALLNQIRALHVYTNGDQRKYDGPLIGASVQLDIKGLSQMALEHPRFRDFCSPVSTTAVLRYLLQKSSLDPLCFALLSWDAGFDIYGNWVLNIAQAAAESSYECWVQRLNGFGAIYERLLRGIPVIVSVRGPLVGSALPYINGHLLVVAGYDVHAKRVICMDPAFSSDEKTLVTYPLSDFLEAWSRRGKIAYLFDGIA